MRHLGIAALVAFVSLCAWAAWFEREHAATRPQESIRVIFVGDIMLDRNVARHAQTFGAGALIATSTRELLSAADLRVGNLEGAVTFNESIAQKDHSILRFTFEPALVREVLALGRFGAVSLANNHAYDFGKDGYQETRANVATSGVAVFGHPLNHPDYLSARLAVKGRQICLVGYHSLFDPGYGAVVAEIMSLEPSCYRIVVFAHWGVEYSTTTTPDQRAAANAFIDAGADLVMGTHPHVVQPVETYRGKAIFYSLGNFLFDQNFSWGTTHALAVTVAFMPRETRFLLTPLTIENQQVSVAAEADRERVLQAAGTVAEFSLP